MTVTWQTMQRIMGGYVTAAQEARNVFVRLFGVPSFSLSQEPRRPAMTDDQQRALEQMHRHLDEHADDWDTRLVLADLLSETGDNWAEACQRWMARHRRCPHQSGSDSGGGWTWFNEEADGLTDALRHAALPAGLFWMCIEQSTMQGGLLRTRQRAEQRLAWALRQTGAMDEVR